MKQIFVFVLFFTMLQPAFASDPPGGVLSLVEMGHVCPPVAPQHGLEWTDHHSPPAVTYQGWIRAKGEERDQARLAFVVPGSQHQVPFIHLAVPYPGQWLVSVKGVSAGNQQVWESGEVCVELGTALELSVYTEN